MTVAPISTPVYVAIPSPAAAETIAAVSPNFFGRMSAPIALAPNAERIHAPTDIGD